MKQPVFTEQTAVFQKSWVRKFRCKISEMINFTFCVQTVLHLQPRTLKVSFATLQLLYQLCTGPACPIPEQSGVAAR